MLLVDSIKKQNDSINEYVESLIDKAIEAEHKNTAEALAFSLEALELATQNDLPVQITRSHVRIGRCHWINGNYEQAIEHLGKALDLSDKVHEIHSKVEALIGLGNVYITMKMFDQSLTYYNNALTIAEDHGFGELESKVLNNLGAMHEELKNFEVALDYFDKSLEKTIELDDLYGTAIANLNMGNVHLKLENIEEAIKYILNAMDYGKKNDKTLMLAHTHFALGEVYQLKKEYGDSIDQLLLGVEKARESKDYYILFRIDIELARSYEMMGQFDQAEKYFNMALEVSMQIGMDELMPRIYEQLSLFYENQGRDDQATHYYKEFYKATKSVEEHRIRERRNSVEYQSKLSESLEETKVYRQLSNELRSSYNNMHVLSKIGQSMTSTHQLDDIFEQLYDNVNLLMNAEGLGVGLFDPDEKVLRFDWFIERGVRLDPFKLSLDNKKSWTIWSFLNKQTLKINDVKKEYKKYIKGVASSRGDLMHSAMFAPLMVEGEVIGVFSIQARERNAYTEAHKDLLQTLASYLAIAIKNATKTKQLAKLNKMLKEKSEHDGLTGIPNRRLFDEIYDKLWMESLEKQRCLSIMIIDIDDFKEFNDQFGHLVGDEVVKSVASLLAKYKREIDFVARYGGDEFVAVLPSCDKEYVQSFADKLKENLLRVNEELDIPSKVTVSIGIAMTVPNKDVLKEKLIYTADNQLYLSKAEGKNRSSCLEI